MGRIRLFFSALLKCAAVAFSVYGMSLTEQGIKMLTQFTNLSNIFGDIALVISLAFDVAIYASFARRKPQWVYVLKYISALSLTLTFFAYMVFLAPNSEYGFWGAYLRNGGASLCVHVLSPVLSIIDFFAFDRAYKPKNYHCLIGCFPPALYFVSIVILGALGMDWNGMAAPYAFLNYAAPAGWFGLNLEYDNSPSFGVGVFYIVAIILILFIAVGRAFIGIINIGKGKRAASAKIRREKIMYKV